MAARRAREAQDLATHGVPAPKAARTSSATSCTSAETLQTERRAAAGGSSIMGKPNADAHPELHKLAAPGAHPPFACHELDMNMYVVDF
jgi:hypothetical protein